jgi:hypothetical protein
MKGKTFLLQQNERYESDGNKDITLEPLSDTISMHSSASEQQNNGGGKKKQRTI